MLSCDKAGEKHHEDGAGSAIKTPAKGIAENRDLTPVKGCMGCHNINLDNKHKLPCITCHAGNNQTIKMADAHAEAVRSPSSPSMMMNSCGKCHPEITRNITTTNHFTLKNEVNTIRQAFNGQEISSLLEIPVIDKPQTPLELVDDLLRRRCLHCHLYYAGDPYPATRHGKGCAACHISYDNGKPVSHNFMPPSDKQCLSCHYGNYVGADYYGRFEHDFNWEYRTPFGKNDGDIANRPYGIRFQQLTPDIHQKAGLSCIDCHSGKELMGNKNKISCTACHLYNSTQHPDNTELIADEVWLNTVNNKKIIIPQMINQAHKYTKIAACEVCHAQWSFNDEGVYLIRQDTDDFDEWLALTRQGNFEVEKELENNLFTDDGSGEARMSDKISGEIKTGIWLKSYKLRRWEPVQICRDAKGILQVCRTIMNLHLSYVNDEDEVIFDNIIPKKNSASLKPYIPHTTGKAGAFFKQRLTP